MIPFSDIDFFMLFAVMIGVGLLVKHFLYRYISLRAYLLTVTLFYLLFFFPKPWSAFLFVAYCYLVYYLLNYAFKVSRKIWGCLLLVLPMVLIKLYSVNMDFISFAGLSYVTFRAIQIHFDNDANYSPKPVNILTFLLFMLFPPTILIGPIDKFNRFNGDLSAGFQNINKGMLVNWLDDLILGILQKFILAEFVDRLWLSKINADSKTLGDMVNMMYAYSVYLYFDFAGYSNMAVGVGKLLGINVPFNFNSPYLAVNPQDFWRRWHASLGDWLRDYVFRPYYKWISGLNRFKKQPLFRQNSALFLTFLIMGCWNGFKSYFVISGAMFGLYSVVHNTYLRENQKKGRDIIFGNLNPRMVKMLSIFIMFNFACLALYIFSGKFPYLN
jgi:membrane protein involved in D-alanine export